MKSETIGDSKLLFIGEPGLSLDCIITLEAYMEEREGNNRCILSGRIASEPLYSHSVYGEDFYRLKLDVPRLSRQIDVLPLTLSERVLGELDRGTNDQMVSVHGQLRSYNKVVDGKSRLIITVFVQGLQFIDRLPVDPNYIELCGYVCKPPIYRTTPFNREITDLLIAVNRGYNKSDYIPCICWGRNARLSGNFEVGSRVIMNGRVQSRDYDKLMDSGEVRRRRVYEVSVKRIAIAEGQLEI